MAKVPKTLEKERPRKINLMLDVSKSIERVVFMNTIAEVCRILHTDPKVGILQVEIIQSKKKHRFNFKIK